MVEINESWMKQSITRMQNLTFIVFTVSIQGVLPHLAEHWSWHGNIFLCASKYTHTHTHTQRQTHTELYSLNLERPRDVNCATDTWQQNKNKSTSVKPIDLFMITTSICCYCGLNFKIAHWPSSTTVTSSAQIGINSRQFLNYFATVQVTQLNWLQQPFLCLLTKLNFCQQHMTQYPWNQTHCFRKMLTKFCHIIQEHWFHFQRYSGIHWW